MWAGIYSFVSGANSNEGEIANTQLEANLSPTSRGHSPRSTQFAPFARIGVDVLGLILGYLDVCALPVLDSALCNKASRANFHQALQRVESGPLLLESMLVSSSHRWEAVFAWMCTRGISAPASLDLPSGYSNETMRIISKCTTLHNILKVNIPERGRRRRGGGGGGGGVFLSQKAMKVFSRFSSLQNFESMGNKISNERLKCLVGLPIEMLNLCGAQLLTDRAMKHIALLTSLRELTICHVPVGDEGLLVLSHGCRSLESLTFSSEFVTDTGFRSLGDPASPLAKTLKKLRIGDLLAVTNEGIKALLGLAALESLALSCNEESSVTGACCEHVAGFPRLSELALGLRNLSDVHLRPLSSCSRLVRLRLLSSSVTGGGLSHLGGASRLVDVEVASDSLTADGLQSLRYLPQLESFSLVSYTALQSDELHLSVLVNLKHLSICGNRDTQTIGALSNATIARLGELKKLESLKLYWCENIDGRALLELSARCPSLKKIGVFGCQGVSRPQMQELGGRGVSVDYSDSYDDDDDDDSDDNDDSDDDSDPDAYHYQDSEGNPTEFPFVNGDEGEDEGDDDDDDEDDYQGSSGDVALW